MKKRILFLCTHNSARSQIAEALSNHFFGDKVEAFSAGTVATKVKPEAIQVLEEIGIDMSKARSKSVEEFIKERFDVVVTVCDHAKETCPFFPNAEKFVHQNFEDPSLVEEKEERVEAFRRTRDLIIEWLKEFIQK